DKGFAVEAEIISGLTYDPNQFIYKGLNNLIEKVLEIINRFKVNPDKESKRNLEIKFAITGGFKAEFAYITLIGSLYNIELYYKHEILRKLMRLPPLSIQINKDFYLPFVELFRLTEQEQNYEQINAKYPNIESNKNLSFLLEKTEDSYRLTPSGKIVKEILDKIRVLVVVDAPNSTNLDLEALSDYAHTLDKNCRLKYVSSSHITNAIDGKAFRLGYDIVKKAKQDSDIDNIVSYEVKEEMKRKHPANIIILGAKDIDYEKTIKPIRDEYGVDFELSVGQTNYARQYDRLGLKINVFKLEHTRKQLDPLSDICNECLNHGYDVDPVEGDPNKIRVYFLNDDQKEFLVSLIDEIDQLRYQIITSSEKSDNRIEIMK
ncbi:MAG: hypothetical protein GF353_10785, partial [Candidatus Lokiarchaeota archaeon]|nr:hypothetical protein [Candidatus Lokiarchaeota archaeon]